MGCGPCAERARQREAARLAASAGSTYVLTKPDGTTETYVSQGEAENARSIHGGTVTVA